MILRATGGIPIDRSNAVSVVSVLAARAAEDESFVIVLAAEGTRSHGEHWKSGFHRLARQTGLPVTFGYIDGPSNTVGMDPTREMTADIRADMDQIRAFYAANTGIRPECRIEPRLRAEASPN